MIRITKTFTRPSANVDFWFSTPQGAAFGAYREATYGAHLSSPEAYLTPDMLTWTYSVTWDSQESYDAMLADPVIKEAMAEYEAYNFVHGITDTENQIVTV